MDIEKRYKKYHIYYGTPNYRNSFYDSAVLTDFCIGVLKERWKDHEIDISKDKIHAKRYIKEFFGNKFPTDEVKTNPLFDIWYEMMLEKILPGLKPRQLTAKWTFETY